MGNPFKGLVLLLFYYISTAEGEIRCYCTESGCVSTGYMCKSQLGMCYTLVKYLDEALNPAQSSVVHGCADTLNRDPMISTCAGKGLKSNDIEEQENDTATGEAANTVEVHETIVIEEKFDDSLNPSEPRLTCCTQDMCNYRDISILIETQPNENRKSFEGVSSERTQGSERPQKDIWFKAAVIAVPIAGGFILILLVLLAVRMLRTDSRHHRRLIQIRRERSLTKAQLYVTDHFVEKEQKVSPCDNHSHQLHSQNNIKRDHSHSHNNHSHSHSHNHNNPHRNSNSHHHHKHSHPKVTTNRDGHTYEQIVTQTTDSNLGSHECKSKQCVPSPYPSVIVWGKPKQTDPGDVV